MKKSLFTLLATLILWGMGVASTSADDIELSTNRHSPSTNQFVNLTIETDDDYVGKLTFSAKYRSSSSTSWTNISNLTSATYFSDYSDEWSDGYYRMRSADDGEITLRNLVKFKKSGYYRIYVKDIYGDQDYIQFSVGSDSSDSDLQISVSPSSPDTDEWIRLTIKTDDDYIGRINFTKLQYRSSNSSSWSNVSMTSSAYVSNYSTEWSNGYYRMTSSDDGEKIISRLLKFKKKWYYRIYVEDIYGNESYSQFSVWVDDDGDSSASSKVDGFSTNELSKVKDVHKRRNSMISQMKSQYINLRRDTYWIKLSNRFYNDMSDVINNKRARDMDDYEDFIEEFNDWYKYTMRNI